MAGVERGLSFSDINRLTLSTWIDFIIEWNSRQTESKSDNGQKATQADFDAF